MKILITGACGFVGSCLTIEFLRKFPTWEILGIDNFSRIGSRDNLPKLKSLGAEIVCGDIRNPADLDGFEGLDWIVDCAANPSVLAGVEGSSRELIENNLYGTVNLLEVCKSLGCGFTLISTSRVYSCNDLVDMPLTETKNRYQYELCENEIVGLGTKGVTELFSTTPPLSLYGSSKLASELLILEYSYLFGFPAYINRCGVMAGKGQFGKIDQGIVGYWIKSWVEKKPLKYIGFNGEGKQTRDCLHPKDLVCLLKKQIANKDESKPRIVNVSGGVENSFSLAELSRWCLKNIDTHEIGIDPLDRKFDIPWLILDASLANKEWEWSVETKLEEIFTEILNNV